MSDAISRVGAGLIHAVRKVYPSQDKYVDLLPPRLPASAESLVRAALLADGGTGYRFIELMEAGLSIGDRRAVLVSSGTAALHLALLALGVGPGDVVAIPAISFIGVANAVTYTGATPYAVDCLYRPLGAINHYKLAQNLGDRKLAAVIAVDFLGHRCVTGDLLEFCTKRGIPLIEDAAAALGSERIGDGVDAYTVSFNNNKIVTMGGGGAVVSCRDDLIDDVRYLSTTAKIRSTFFFEHSRVGFNYRPNNLGAALGVAHFQELPQVIACKREIARRYQNAIDPETALFVLEPDEGGSNYWLNAAMIDPRWLEPPATRARNIALGELHIAGIASRAMFMPLIWQEPYQGMLAQPDLSVAIDIYRRTVCLPSGIDLGRTK